MEYFGFVGNSVLARSRTQNCEWTNNLYIEASAGTPKRAKGLYSRPCLVPWTLCAPGPIRAMHFQDGRLNVVSGNYYYDVQQSRNVTILGEVQQDSHPATISTNGTNGNQNFVTSGGLGYIHDLSTGSFVQISDANFPDPTIQGAYIDADFVALKGGSNTFQWSAALDGLTWPGLNIAQASSSSDNKISMVVSHREIWLFGSKNTEVWANTPNAYEPVPGVFVEHGIAAPWTATRLDNTVYWVGLDEAGTAVVWRANGYTPERISDHALEYQLQSLPRLDDMRGLAFQMGGHGWYLLYSPHVPTDSHGRDMEHTTYVFDINAQAWTDWSHWSDRYMRFFPFVGTTHANAWNGLTLIGDRQSGTIYRLSFQHFTDRLVIKGGL